MGPVYYQKLKHMVLDKVRPGGGSGVVRGERFACAEHAARHLHKFAIPC